MLLFINGFFNSFSVCNKNISSILIFVLYTKKNLLSKNRKCLEKKWVKFAFSSPSLVFFASKFAFALANSKRLAFPSSIHEVHCVTLVAESGNKADRHKSRAPSNQFPTDGRTDRPTEWPIESRARD